MSDSEEHRNAGHRDRRQRYGYEEIGGDVLEVWEREHRNGDRTHVAAIDTGEIVLALASDIDEHGDPLAAEVVATTYTPDEAREQARAWLSNNETGVGDSGSGVRELLNL